MDMYAAFDIGGSGIKHALINSQGEIKARGKLPVASNWDEFLADLVRTIKEYMTTNKISGVAISAPGAVDSATGIIGGSSAIAYIHGPSFKQCIAAQTGLRVELENDANCAALAEVWQGAAKHLSNVAFFVCGSGIGGCMIKDRQIHHGAHLHGGEFGYMVLAQQNGRPQTLSELGSTGGLVKHVARRLQADERPLDGVRIFDLAAQGDAICRKAIDRFYYYLALGIYNIQYMYDPELIIIGGAISERAELIQCLNEKLEEIQRAIPAAKVKPEISKCHFNNDANLIGALYHYITVVS